MRSSGRRGEARERLRGRGRTLERDAVLDRAERVEVLGLALRSARRAQPSQCCTGARLTAGQRGGRTRISTPVASLSELMRTSGVLPASGRSCVSTSNRTARGPRGGKERTDEPLDAIHHLVPPHLDDPLARLAPQPPPPRVERIPRQPGEAQREREAEREAEEEGALAAEVRGAEEGRDREREERVPQRVGEEGGCGHARRGAAAWRAVGRRGGAGRARCGAVEVERVALAAGGALAAQRRDWRLREWLCGLLTALVAETRSELVGRAPRSDDNLERVERASHSLRAQAGV